MVFWKYHFDCLLGSDVKVQYLNELIDESTARTSNRITLATIECALKNLQRLTKSTYDCLVIQDEHQLITIDALTKLQSINAINKIILCSDDIMVF